MRVVHEFDCDFEIVGVCTCGAFNKCKRTSAPASTNTRPGSAREQVFGMREHETNLKKLRELLQSEKAAATAPAPDGVPGPEPTPPAGGEASPFV